MNKFNNFIKYKPVVHGIKTKNNIFSSGLPHILQINRSIKAIHKHFKESIEYFKHSLYNFNMPSHSKNPEVAAQRIALIIAKHYRLEIGTILVAFRFNLAKPAIVELSKSNDFFIEVHNDYKFKFNQMVAILSHEITHIFLYRIGLSFPKEIDNEILTDTTATYLGLGTHMLAALTFNKFKNSIKSLGYLTPNEYGYILSKRAMIFGDNPSRHIYSELANSALDSGCQYFNRMFYNPPFSQANWLSRCSYNNNKDKAKQLLQFSNMKTSHIYDCKEYSFDHTKIFLAVIFSCPICLQKLRIPVDNGEIWVKCPICKGEFKCKS